jgi:hypothetical protein
MKLRWFQFRLRTMFIEVTLFAFPCAWLGHEYRKRSTIRVLTGELS